MCNVKGKTILSWQCQLRSTFKHELQQAVDHHVLLYSPTNGQTLVFLEEYIKEYIKLMETLNTTALNLLLFTVRSEWSLFGILQL